VSETQRQLPPVPKSAMFIFAHPDDAEFVSAGTAAAWAAEGCEITYVVGTNGDKGTSDPNFPTDELIAARQKEQRDAADILGVKHVEFLGYPDAMLVPDLDLRLALTRMIRKHKPEAVVCQDPMTRYVGQEYIQHPDHMAMAEASLAAIFPSARDHLTFPQLLEEGYEPHKVKYVYLTGSEAPDVWVDITAVFDTKAAALKAHVSQVGEWDPAPMLRQWARDTAADARRNRFPGFDEVELAESYKFFKLD
jgi:LmbE family N-acetylglucosaminyl deacetylase